MVTRGSRRINLLAVSVLVVLSILLLLLVLVVAVALLSCDFADAHWSGEGAAYVAGALGLVHGLDVISELVDSQHGPVVVAVV